MVPVSDVPQDVPDGMWYDPETRQVRTDAIAIDAAAIAKRTGLPVDKVLASLEAQLQMDELLAAVQSRFPDTFVGLYWDDEMQAVAQFKGQAPAEALRILGASGVGVRAELVTYSASELDALRDNVERSLEKQGLREWVVALDSRNQLVLVTIGEGAGTDSNAIASELREAFAAAPVVIDSVDGPVTKDWNTYGGGVVRSATNLCTAGFTVKSGSTNGVATAGHCGSGLNLYVDPFPNPDVSHTMTYKNGVVGYWGDFEWFTTSGTEFDDFYLPNGARRDVSGVKNTFAIGDSLNWWGWATFPNLWVDTVAFLNVSWGGVSHMNCTTGLGGDVGDSGGPFFVGNTAAGFMKGAAVINGAWRTCFSQARYIDDAIGVSIKTS
jgi:streptogrisin B